MLKLQYSGEPLKEIRPALLIQQESQLLPVINQVVDLVILPSGVLDARQDAPGVQERAVREHFDPQLIHRKFDVSGIVPKCRLVVREPYPYTLRHHFRRKLQPDAPAFGLYFWQFRSVIAQGRLFFRKLHIAVSNKQSGVLFPIEPAQRSLVEEGPLLHGDVLLTAEKSPQDFIAVHMAAHLVPLQREQAVHRPGHILGWLMGHSRGEGDALFDAQYLQMPFQPLPLLHRPRQAQEHLVMIAKHHTISIPPSGA